jgi:hypothetical protein
VLDDSFGKDKNEYAKFYFTSDHDLIVVARPSGKFGENVWNVYRLIIKNGIDQITIVKHIQMTNKKKNSAFAVNELGICVMQDDMLVIKDLESFETIRSKSFDKQV